MRDGRVQVNGRVVVRPSTKLHAGQVVDVSPPTLEATALLPQADVPFEVVYADDDLVVVDKPAGVVMHPGAGHPDGTLVNGVLHHVGSLSNIGASHRPGVVHRIDAGTSGLVVVARTDAAHQHLARQFAEHTVERRYQALVWSKDIPDEGTLDTPYGRHPQHRVLFTSMSGERRAVTHWRVLERLPPCTLVELRLETGRTHQIRVHLSEAGAPLLGDPQYSRPRRIERPQFLRRLGLDLGLTRQALHAARLGFLHPDGRQLSFESPLPADFAAAVEVLRAQWA